MLNPNVIKSLRNIYSSYFRARLLLVRGLTISQGVIVKGMPIVDTSDGGTIYIGRGATLNSRNKGYHVNMHSPVKLIADRKGATIRIGAETRINGTCVHAYTSVTIGEKCLIGGNCQIIDCNGHGTSFGDSADRISTAGEGNPVVIDLDGFAIGPREWDVVLTAMYYDSFGWHTREEYETFVQIYGFDIMTWPGYPVLREIREFLMVTWVIQKAGESEEIAAEARKRIAALRTGASRRDWQPY